jgi:exodeoxyribonuclease V gamma subunit
MIEPGFMVLQSNRLENLRQVTVEWLRRYPLAPLENEVLLVQSNGIAQWLKLALAADTGTDEPGCGVAAALAVNLPGRFHWQAYRAVLGDLPETSPYDKQLLSWRLLRLLPTLLSDPQFSALQHFLNEDSSQRKLFQLAQRLADLFDQYQIYRADWLQDWSRGFNRITQNNQSTDLPDAQNWQAELWRRLQDDIIPAARNSGRAQIHQQFREACTALSPDTRPASLPRRVVVFGLSSLPRQSLEVLAEIARCTQVLLCVHNPCMHYWGDIIEPHLAQRLFDNPYKRQAKRQDMPSAHDAAAIDELFLRGNPLLAAWGKQGRDYIRLLDEHDDRSSYESGFRDNKLSIDLFEAPVENHLLGRIQADIYHLRSLAEARAAHSAANSLDGLSFHIAHSAQREVEILQDHLLRLFNNQPDLRPRDVLVMVPDINQFAPHIQAVFGRINRDDTRFIPFTVSDQGKRHQAPLFLALSMLMNITSSRFGVSELLDLMDVPAVQQAFDLDAADKALLHRWVQGAGIRWGLNAGQRIAQGLPDSLSDQVLEQNTWQFGLRRMLLGYAVGKSTAWQNIEPYAEIGGLSASVTGKLMHLLSALEKYWELFRHPADVSEWVQRISKLINECFKVSDDYDTQLLSRTAKHLQSWQTSCEQADFHDLLPVEIVSEFVLEALDEPDLSQRFLAGSVNFATLMPMRAIPFRHICLLGMNDGDYPRQVPAVDFDLMRQDYRPGDRSRREDDRYLFLEALLSARDSLYISWTGRSIRDNSERPPSVLVAQLRDYIRETVTETGTETVPNTGAKSVLASITREYPLQPFSDQYFSSGSAYETFAHEWQPASTPEASGAVSAGAAGRIPVDDTPVSLKNLVTLLRNPAAVYFEKKLGIVFSDEDLAAEDHELFQLDGLSRWKLTDELLGQLREAMAHNTGFELDIEKLLDTLVKKQERSGSLPMAPFSEVHLRQMCKPLIKPLQRYQTLLREYDKCIPQPVSLSSADNTVVLEDTLSDIRSPSDSPSERIRCVLFASQIWQGKERGKGKPKWHYLVREWPLHLAAQLEGPVRTHLLGPDTDEVLQPLTQNVAREQLQQLLQLWQDNLQYPLAAEVKTSHVFLTTEASKDPVAEATKCYEGGYHMKGEVQRQYALYRLWPSFADLFAEQQNNAITDQPQSRFANNSRALYQPLIDHWAQYRQARTSDEEDAA